MGLSRHGRDSFLDNKADVIPRYAFHSPASRLKLADRTNVYLFRNLLPRKIEIIKCQRRIRVGDDITKGSAFSEFLSRSMTLPIIRSCIYRRISETLIEMLPRVNV